MTDNNENKQIDSYSKLEISSNIKSKICESNNYYNAISKSYDELHSSEQLEKLMIIKSLIKKYNPDLESSGQLLDVGCGTGISTFYFSSIFDLLIGVDPASSLIDIAKKKLLGENIFNIKFFVSPAEDIKLDSSFDNSFNVVVSVTAIQNFASIYLGLTSIKRFVCKNGLVVISILKNSSKIEELRNELNSIFGNSCILEEVVNDKDMIFVIRG